MRNIYKIGMRDLWCELEFGNFPDYAHRKVLQLEMQDWISLVKLLDKCMVRQVTDLDISISLVV